MSTQQQRQEWRKASAERMAGETLYRHDEKMLLDAVPALLDAVPALLDAVPALLADVDALTQERDALAAELERVRAQLDAVPVDDIRKVTKAADMDGYSNWRVDEWLDELAQLAHTPTPGTR